MSGSIATAVLAGTAVLVVLHPVAELCYAARYPRDRSDGESGTDR